MAHILIIDDSPTEQAGLSQMLQKHGHICFFCQYRRNWHCCR
jgi:twitching motility two-component system response regulator PilH